MAERVYYGGQAVIEGVMMRGQKAAAVAVRRPDGELAIDIQPLSRLYTGWLRKVPFARGIIVLLETLVLGTRALLYSANQSLEGEDEEISRGLIWLTLLGSLVFAVFLFFIVPLLLTGLLNIKSSLLFNLADGLIRVAIFIAYLKLTAMMPDIRRVFAYHGAEHKVVNAYESGLPLELEAAKGCSKAHVRCGTSFLFVVVIISVFVFALVGVHSVGLMVLSRILLVPLIASLAYEVIYFGGRHSYNGLVRAVLTPGLWLQALTTREPDDKQLEVALAAMEKIVETDEAGETVQPVT
ncbi:MAG: DUF1385 domain-containing protein [Dehalococcoidales bacterium]|nr:DUF1385 domain-containing protein [Dehalococcoidales bacterium]